MIELIKAEPMTPPFSDRSTSVQVCTQPFVKTVVNSSTTRNTSPVHIEVAFPGTNRFARLHSHSHLSSACKCGVVSAAVCMRGGGRARVVVVCARAWLGRAGTACARQSCARAADLEKKKVNHKSDNDLRCDHDATLCAMKWITVHREYETEDRLPVRAKTDHEVTLPR